MNKIDIPQQHQQLAHVVGVQMYLQQNISCVDVITIITKYLQTTIYGKISSILSTPYSLLATSAGVARRAPNSNVELIISIQPAKPALSMGLLCKQ